MDRRECASKLTEAIQHQQVVAGAALFMATIGKNLAAKFLLKKAHGTAMHRLSIRSSELKPSKGKSREVFEPMVAAVAVLRMGL